MLAQTPEVLAGAAATLLTEAVASNAPRNDPAFIAAWLRTAAVAAPQVVRAEGLELGGRVCFLRLFHQCE
jgi:hypothetical protein